MIDVEEFRTRMRLDARSLASWTEAGWLRPLHDAGGGSFSEIDLARAQLIHDLKEDIRINDDGVTITLDLLDQMHGLRRMLYALLSAVHAQPEATQHRIVTDMRAGIGSRVRVPAHQDDRP